MSVNITILPPMPAQTTPATVWRPMVRNFWIPGGIFQKKELSSPEFLLQKTENLFLQHFFLFLPLTLLLKNSLRITL